VESERSGDRTPERESAKWLPYPSSNY
jgi:hypothetical protein